MKRLLFLGVAAASIFWAGNAEAAILVSGDTNIIPFATGTIGPGIDPGNVQFFTNLLENQESVLVQQKSSLVALSVKILAIYTMPCWG